MVERSGVDELEASIEINNESCVLNLLDIYFSEAV